MRIDIITVMPDLLESPFNYSITKRAKDKKLAEVVIHNLRNYSKDKHKRVDDYSFGGDSGMVMTIEPIYNAITDLKTRREYDEIIYTAPDGKLFNQQIANKLSTLENIIILCGHYKGIDHRIREHLITMELSIGNYVMSGGELAAAVISDCIIRLLPGVLGDETSALTDSFQDNLLAPPVYSRPSEFNGWKVPEILLSGNDAEIYKWKFNQSIERTKLLRPELLEDNDTE